MLDSMHAATTSVQLVPAPKNPSMKFTGKDAPGRDAQGQGVLCLRRHLEGTGTEEEQRHPFQRCGCRC